LHFSYGSSVPKGLNKNISNQRISINTLQPVNIISACYSMKTHPSIFDQWSGNLGCMLIFRSWLCRGISREYFYQALNRCSRQQVLKYIHNRSPLYIRF